jgi:hypothetical protein
LSIVSLTANIADILDDPVQDALDDLKRTREALISAGKSHRTLVDYWSNLLGPEPSPKDNVPTFPVGDDLNFSPSRRSAGFGPWPEARMQSDF